MNLNQIKLNIKKEKYKILVIVFLLAACCSLTYYYHVIVKNDNVFTHIFYIPIILSAIWWKRKGFLVTVFLAVLLVFINSLYITEVLTINNFLRILIFLVISLMVIIISEKIWAARKDIEHLNMVLYTIRNVERLLIHEKDLNRLIQGICDNLIATRGYLNAWIALFDENKTLLSIAEAGLGEVFLPMIEKMKQGDLTNCSKQALYEPGILVIKDPIYECTDCPLSSNYDNRGGLVARLEYDKKVYGFMTVSVPLNFLNNKEVHKLFKEVADDIAFALHIYEQEKMRKQTDKYIQKNKERINQLSMALINSQENERQRIARELHDSVVQTILASKINFQEYQKNPEKGNNHFNMGLQFLSMASKELREISTNLYPSILSDIGLEAAIRWYTKNYLELNGINTQIIFNLQEKIYHELKINFYRIIQELFSNIIKHSEADFVTVEIFIENNNIILKVGDNGVGFNYNKLTQEKKGLGLLNIHQRTESLGGEMRIASDSSKGTQIAIIIPDKCNE